MIIKHYTKHGLKDGILIHKTIDIKYYETDTEYLNGIKLIIKNQDSLLNQTFKINNSKKNTITLIKFLKN